MSKVVKRNSTIKVELIIRDNCNYCDRISHALSQLNDSYPELRIITKNITQVQGSRQSIGGITPAIWVKDKLWFLGSFNSDIFCDRINGLIQNPTLLKSG